MNAKDFIKALKALEGEKNIPVEIVIDSLKQALVSAYQTIENAKDVMARVDVDPKKGIIRMFAQKNIVEEVEDDYLQISLEDARVYNPDFQVGDIFETEVNVDDFNDQEYSDIMFWFNMACPAIRCVQHCRPVDCWQAPMPALLLRAKAGIHR